MAVSIIGPKFYAWDSDTGAPLAFGKVFTYQAGTNTPKATFQSEDGVTANANPTILNGAGYANIYLDGSYKVVVKDADDVEVWTSDPVTDPSGLQKEWINERAATQVSPTSFSIVGNHTDVYTAGKALQLDDASYLYGYVDSVTYVGGNTVVEVASDDPLTGSLTRSWTGIVGMNSLPQVVSGSFESLQDAVSKRVIRVTSIAAMLDITPIDALQISVENYHSNYFGGGGLFSWDATKDKADHNGGTVIDPDIVFPTDWSDQTERTAWFTASTGAGCWVIQADTATSIMWFGAVGDGVVNDRDSINECIGYCRNNGVPMYIPAGEFLCLSPFDSGAFLEIFGDGTKSRLLPSFSSSGYLFDITGTGTGVSWRSFSVYGPDIFSATTNFAKFEDGYFIRFEYLKLQKLGVGLNLETAWGTYVSKCFFLYVGNPLSFGKGNGASVRDCYIIRYQGAGIVFTESLSPRIDNVILEYGDGGYAISLQATQSAVITNIYTENGDATDIRLTFKNQKSCVNTTIKNCWLNANGPAQIKCRSYRGLEIDNIVINNPASSQFIDFADNLFSNGYVNVGKVCQLNQNANGGIGDVRGTGDTLIPMSNDNTRIVVATPHQKYGDGTDADLENIANHTVKDGNGHRPRLYVKPKFNLGAVVSGLTATSSSSPSVYGSESSGITIYSDDWGSSALLIHADVTGPGTVSSTIKLTNQDTGDVFTAYKFGDGSLSQGINLEVQPGENNFTLSVSKVQGDAGTNVWTVTGSSIIT